VLFGCDGGRQPDALEPLPDIRRFSVDHSRGCRRIGAYFGRELGSPCLVNKRNKGKNRRTNTTFPRNAMFWPIESYSIYYSYARLVQKPFGAAYEDKDLTLRGELQGHPILFFETVSADSPVSVRQDPVQKASE
jgi:hypothetical protein